MSEYLPLHDEGNSYTRVASASITGGQVVIVSGSGSVAPATAASNAWLGLAGFDASTGDQITVYSGGVQRCIAGTGGVTAGTQVEAAAGGTVVTHTNGTSDVNAVGLALTTVAAGTVVEVRLNR